MLQLPAPSHMNLGKGQYGPVVGRCKIQLQHRLLIDEPACLRYIALQHQKPDSFAQYSILHTPYLKPNSGPLKTPGATLLPTNGPTGLL